MESDLSPEPYPPGLMLVHGNHPETLRELLVTWMKRYPLAPLENEIILVQSNGIAQWLKLALAADEGAGGCGIAASLEFVLPARFLWRVYRAVLGRDAVPEESLFDKPRLTWRLMRLLPEVLGQAVYAPLLRFLENDGDLRKRFQLAERLADLFDQYQVYRADWLAAWAVGEDVLLDARANRTALPDEQRWQGALWRALLADVARHQAESQSGDAAPAAAGRAAVHAAFMARTETRGDDIRPPGLPRRVMVFGISALPRQSLEVLAALARWTQVLMCVHNPCEHHWADIVADRELLRAAQSRQARRAGMPALVAPEHLHLHAQPLLAAWGKQGRDFIGLLDEHDSDAARAGYARHFDAIGQRIDLFASHGEACLLNQLQDDIRELRPLAETRERWPGVRPAQDDSIRFHVAHGPQREVEVLHDQLLAAFNAHPDLRPRDVIVMVPDIDAYAPHIQAVFGLLDSNDPRFIPFSVADQGARRIDPLARAVEMLLALPQSRVSVSDVLDLLEVPAVRRRFAIGDDDLPTLHAWIRGANIRWGLHATQRASLGLPEQVDEAAPNTWLFGLRRMLLGYATGSDGGAWNGIEPFDEIGGLNAALLGPLVQLVERLDAAWRSLREPATVAAWCERLRSLIEDFFVAEGGAEAFTLVQLESALESWLAACDEAALSEALPLSVVADHWLAQLDQTGLSQRFFGGAVTFATLMPMRAIPFRQVCLLGMNDGDYPRTRVPMDFDLMGRDYRPGDRSRREDDRYLFLEALMSARERLLVSWVGRSIHDNTPRPPSVLVGQLRDHLKAGWRLADEFAATADPDALLAALTIEHPLQAFSPAYFPARAGASPLFTYAHEWRSMPAAGEAGTGQSAELPGDHALRLRPVVRSEPLTLRELGDFLKDPVKTFFRERLDVAFERDDPVAEDQEPFALDALAHWRFQDELIQTQARALADEQALDEARAARLAHIRARGELAAGAFGELMESALEEGMDELFERYRVALARWPVVEEGEHEVRFETLVVGAPLGLGDWLGGMRRNAAGQAARVVLESSALIKDKHYRYDKLIHHWVVHLGAHLVAGPLTTMVVGKLASVELLPLSVAEVESHLGRLLGMWAEGMRRPLPLAPKTAFAWLAETGDAGGLDESAFDPTAQPTPGVRLNLPSTKVVNEYDGAFKKKGEVETSAYLQRAYPSFEMLFASGEFQHLAETLLRPLTRAVLKAEKAGGKARAEGAPA